MEEKLRSISKTIPWYLVLKSAVFGFSWYFLPYPLFLLVGLLLYFIPLFHPFRYIYPFFLILFFGWILNPNFLAALLFGILFFLLLGIKDLVLVNRYIFYQVLSLLLFFLLLLNFFARFSGSDSGGILVWSLFAAFSFAVFLKNLFDLKFSDEEWSGKKKTLIFGLSGFIIWQWIWAIMFLPLNVFYQTAIMFLISAALLELLMDYSGRSLTNRKLLTYFSVAFVFIVLVLAGNNWGI